MSKLRNGKQDKDKFGRRLSVFGEPINPDMGEGRWQDALRRMRASITVIPLELEDCNEIGSKSTHCSWGMCSQSREQWPDKDDHIFPEDFARRKRIAPRGFPGPCPLDEHPERGYRIGCFFRCLAFKKGLKDRQKVLELYDLAILSREKGHGRKTTGDDQQFTNKQSRNGGKR